MPGLFDEARDDEMVRDLAPVPPVTLAPRPAPRDRPLVPPAAPAVPAAPAAYPDLQERTQSASAAPLKEPKEPAARSRRSGYRYPDAHVAPAVAARLREVANRERSVDPDAARPHGLIVLQAIERNQRQIEEALKRPHGKAASEGSLFSRVDPRTPVSAQRRHHPVADKPVRITLTGVIKADAKVIDDLARKWANGNRSMLVETALRLEFDMPA